MQYALGPNLVPLLCQRIQIAWPLQYYKSFQILPINLFLSQISNLYFRIRNNPIPIIRISIQVKK